MMKNVSLLSICLWAMMLLATKANAQTYTMKRLGVEDGLSNNYVVDIAQDGQGNLWFATEAGLNCFDGNGFTVYKKSNSPLCGDALNALYYDKESDYLWIGSQRDGVSVFDGRSHQFIQLLHNDSLMTKDVTEVSPAADGGIWITHYHNGVEHYNKETGVLTAYHEKDIPGLRSPNWCSADDGNGRLYIGHTQHGLSILDIEKRTVRNFRHDPDNPHSLPNDEVRYICIDSRKNVWVGTSGGLALFNPNTETFITFRHDPANPASLLSNHVRCIKEMRSGSLWISTDYGGVSVLNLNNTAFIHPSAARFTHIKAGAEGQGLSSPSPRRMLQDSYGNVWIANYRGGVDFVSNEQPPFQMLPYVSEREDGEGSREVRGICVDDEQRIWLGGENELVHVRNKSVVDVIHLSRYAGKHYILPNVIYHDVDNVLWLGLESDGILQVKAGTQDVKRIPFPTSGAINTFYEDVDRKLWIGTETGVYSYRDGNVVEETVINSQLPDRVICSILRDRQGCLWIGTFGKGISVFNKENQLLFNFVTESGFCSNAVNHLFMDSQGSVWVATRNGLACFKDTAQPKHYEVYGSREGLEEEHVRAIQEDQQGNIWVSTNGGISRWDAANRKFTNYNHHEGIPRGDFMDGSTCITADGTIYFGSQNGLCFFQPEHVASPKEVAPVRIVECKVFNRQAEGREEASLIPLGGGAIELSHDRNSFSLSFNVPDYAQSRQAEYAYLLEGLDPAWYNTQGENQVTFRSLPSGSYVFKVKARLRNQEWDEAHMASLRIDIRPPFWLAWYAKLFYALALCAALYWLLRRYKRRLDWKSSIEVEREKSRNEQELNNERLRFYTNITHELRTPLTLIIGPLEDLLHDRNLSPTYAKRVNIIYDSAVSLLNLINQLLEFRKAETQNRRLLVGQGDISTLVMETGLRFKELSQNKKVAIRVNIDTEATQLLFDREMVTTILNNLLSNALKYTAEGDIRLTLRSVSENGINYTEMEVADTGYGIAPEALPHIFDRYYQAEGKHQASGSGIGLALVKSLVKLHEGSIDVQSELGKGTIFTFRIRTDNTYPQALHKDVPVEQKQLPAPVEEEKVEETQPVLLVVEDNEDIREYVRTSFMDSYKVLTAANGKEGLELARTAIPDIIVSDVMMPVMDGIELCQAVKKDICTSHIPVILLTAKDSIQDKEVGYESGADSYITKPFSARLLESRIHNLMEMRRKLAKQLQKSAPEAQVQVSAEEAEPTAKPNKLDSEFLEKLTCIIEENIEMDKMDVAFIADKMNMSHSTLYRKTKGLTEMSINEFVRKVKIRYAARLLREEGYNVSEAAYMIGFFNRGYFRQCFKDEFGVTPSEYVKA